MLIEKEDAIQAVCEACYMYKYIGDEYKECRYYPCDDIKALEAIPSAEQVTSKLESAEAVPQLRQTDTLIIADALRYLAKDTERHLVDRTRADALRQQFLRYGASMCHSADGTRRKEP